MSRSRSFLARARFRAVLLWVLMGLWGLWAVALAGPASAALPSNCSQSGITVTCTFGYTGADQTWTVPAGVTSATFDAQGAQGGSIDGFTTGGGGGEATADLSQTPGAAVTLVVGGQGGSPPACAGAGAGGFNGGAAGGGGVCPGGGGGGASDVRISGIGLTDRVLVAGGGGGAGNAAGLCGDSNGGGGGGLSGAVGADASCGGHGGSGGNQDGTSGSGNLGNGSVGATATGFSPSGGGGGGGYYGGAGGGQDAGGGGGSGFGPTGTTFQTGVRSGNGQVTISYTAPTAEASPAALSFATQPQSTLSAPQAVTLTNVGGNQLLVYGLTFTGSDPQDFLITSDGCLGPIAAGASCTIGVSFAPQAQGARTATLQIDSNDPDDPPASVPLSGTGGSLPHGPTGATGATGAQGPAGRRGPRGPAGRVRLVVCRTPVTAPAFTGSADTIAARARDAKLVCSTRIVSGVVTFTIGSHAIAASLARAHMVYASGVGVAMGAGRWQLLLQDRRTLRRGSYTLTLRSPQNGRWVTHRKSITIT